MDNKKTKIIPAEITHAKALAELHVRAWQKAYKNIVTQEIMNSFSIEKRTEAFTEAIVKKTEQTYVYMLDKAVAGFVTYGKCRDSDVNNTGEIWGIYLNPKFWRKGIGTKLANWTMNNLKRSGFEKVVLWVFKDNLPSRKFYESIGFIPDGCEKTIDTCNADAMRYTKEIS